MDAEIGKVQWCVPFFLTLFCPSHPTFPVASRSSQVRSVVPFLDDQSRVRRQSQAPLAHEHADSR